MKTELKAWCNIRLIIQACATVLHKADRDTRTEEHGKGTGIEIWYLALPTMAMVTVDTSNEFIIKVDFGCHHEQMVFSAALSMWQNGLSYDLLFLVE